MVRAIAVRHHLLPNRGHSKDHREDHDEDQSDGRPHNDANQLQSGEPYEKALKGM